MAIQCEICGRKISGFSGGAFRATEDYYIKAKELSLDLQENICMYCAGNKISIAKSEQKARQAEEDLKIVTALEGMFVTPAPIPEGTKDLGLVTGYCIMGTGPLTTIASSWTDFFGAESTAYLEKIAKAEDFALLRAKQKAYKMGASAIYNVRIGLSEAATGHGMLMISVFGSATKK
ncbi:MAG: YbjQ family protein [Desulfovibrio sp.]|nr:YbjQ family protein [Desulfovibrio sp.]